MMRKIVLVLMLVLGFGLTNASANENTPEGVILAFLEAAKNGNLDKMISYMDKDSFMKDRRRIGVLKDERERFAEGYLYLNSDTVSGKPVDKSQWQFKVVNKIDYYDVKISNVSLDRQSSRVVKTKKVNGVWKISALV